MEIHWNGDPIDNRGSRDTRTDGNHTTIGTHACCDLSPPSAALRKKNRVGPAERDEARGRRAGGPRHVRTGVRLNVAANTSRRLYRHRTRTRAPCNESSRGMWPRRIWRVGARVCAMAAGVDAVSGERARRRITAE